MLPITTFYQVITTLATTALYETITSLIHHESVSAVSILTPWPFEEGSGSQDTNCTTDSWWIRLVIVSYNAVGASVVITW